MGQCRVAAIFGPGTWATQRRPNISLHPDFNEMVGFTELEVLHLVETRPVTASRGSARE